MDANQSTPGEAEPVTETHEPDDENLRRTPDKLESQLQKLVEAYQAKTRISFSNIIKSDDRPAVKPENPGISKGKRTPNVGRAGEIKSNTSYTLRYDFLRKKAAIPSTIQKHIEKFNKPPFRNNWKHGSCYDEIADLLKRNKIITRKPKITPSAPPAEGTKQGQ